MTRRKQVAVLFTMPLVIFLWLIGFTLITFDMQKKAIETETSNKKEQSLVVMIPEQEIFV